MALNKRVWRIIGENKGRYIGIFILILLGSFSFAVMSNISGNLERLVGGFAEKNFQEDINFRLNKPIENIVELEIASGALIDSYLSHDVPVDGGELRLLSPSTKVNIPAVKSGRWLENPGDILLDPWFMLLQGLDTGDQIEIGGKTYNIVGVFAIPNYAYVLKYINDVMPTSGFGIAMISDGDFKDFSEATTVYSAFFTNREDVSGQRTALNTLLTENGYVLSEWVAANNNRRIQMPWASITGGKTMTVPMAVVIFLLVCLIVGLIVRRMVKADSVVIGTLYAQGYRRRELTRHYMAIPFILSIVGGLAGTLLAIPCVSPAITTMTAMYNVPNTGISVSLSSIVIGVIMPVPFLCLSCWLVVRKVLKRTAAELMKGYTQKAEVNFIERGLSLDRFNFNTKFMLREQARSIPRLMFLLFGVSIASMMLLFGFTMNNSMNIILDGATDDTFNFAIEYSFMETQAGSVPEGAEPFNAMRAFPEERENAEFYVMAMSPDTAALTLRDARGNPLSGSQVNITYPMAHRLKLGVGDTIRFVNTMDGKMYSLKIDGVVQTYAGQFIFMPLDAFNSMTEQAPGSYSGLLSDRELLEIDASLLSGVKDMRNTGAMDDLAGTMTGMVVFMAFLAGLIGAVIIFLVTSLVIEESRNTISMLKVFGYRGREVARLILNSSAIVVVSGLVLGLPLMLAFGNGLYGYLGEMINLVLPMIVNPLHVIISFIILYAVYWLTRMLCGKKLAKISMGEALKAGTE